MPLDAPWRSTHAARSREERQVLSRFAIPRALLGLRAMPPGCRIANMFVTKTSAVFVSSVQ